MEIRYVDSAEELVTPSLAGVPGKLNVIFHGAFVFVVPKDPKDNILVLLPDMDSKHEQEHVYRAGNWLGETTLQRKKAGGADEGGIAATHVLEGVDRGDASFKRERNLVFEGSHLAKDAGKRIYAAISVPVPEEIYSLRAVPLRSDTFTEGSTISPSLHQLALSQVFAYRFQSDAALRITNHFWEPAFAGRTINLHIICSHERDHPPSHANHAIEVCASLLTGVKLGLNSLQAEEPGAGERLPPGLSEEELDDLVIRTRRLVRLGRAHKQGRSLGALLSDSDPLDSKTQACTSLVVGP